MTQKPMLRVEVGARCADRVERVVGGRGVGVHAAAISSLRDVDVGESRFEF